MKSRRRARYFRDQDYERLKRECVRNRSLFVDPEFPPSNVSLFLDTDTERAADVVWKRPGKFCLVATAAAILSFESFRL